MKSLFFCIIILLVSCAHNDPEKTYLKPSTLEKDSCLEVLKKSKRDPATKVFDETKEGIGTGVSYLLTGAGYATDFVFIVVGGIAVGITICSPLIALEAGHNGSGNASGECIGKVTGTYIEHFPFNLGHSTYKNTEKMRCPEVDHISKALRKVAACYTKKKSFQKAKQQLDFIKDDRVLAKCTSVKEKANINNELYALSRM